MNERTYNCPVEIWLDENYKIRLIPIIIRGEITSTYQLYECSNFQSSKPKANLLAPALPNLTMFEDMVKLGNAGASRFMAFYADGDGDFHPKIVMQTSEPLPNVEYITRKEQMISAIPYDYDNIAWKIRILSEGEKE